uniref:Uncharacterized protein n=1 Tax=Acrobeloides nanus TaxID=290746 RepID=A0A914E392_9BILA
MSNNPTTVANPSNQSVNQTQLAMTKLCLGGEIIKIPTALVES